MKTVLAVSAALLISGTSWAADGAPEPGGFDQTVDATGTAWQQPADSQMHAYREAGNAQAQPSGESSPRLQPPTEDFSSFDERCRLADGFGTWSSSDGCVY
jgi:hypothetical protein